MTGVPNDQAGPATFQRLDSFLLLIVGLLSSVWCLTAAQRLGPTFDEPFYILQGLDYWRTGNRSQLLLADVMPLSAYLQTLPLSPVRFSAMRLGHTIGGPAVALSGP